jgi:hypothetical protein
LKKVILVSAKARHGKDSLADYLKQKLEAQGNKVAVMHFAQYIKDILVRHYGWDRETKNEYWRHMLQYLGTEKIRIEMKKPLFHVSRICEDIEIIADDFDYIIIPDTRFRNEVTYTQSVFPYNTMTVRVHRLNFESELTEEQKQHISEIDLDSFKFDYNIYVQNGLQHLYDETDRVFKGVLY